MVSGDLIPPPRDWSGRARTAAAILSAGARGTRLLSDAARYTLIRKTAVRTRDQATWLLRGCVGSPKGWPGRAPLVVASALVASAALPFSSGPPLWASDEAATAFLGLLWQVTAGTLGVAVAALIFLYETFRSAASHRRVLGLSEFATRSGVLNLVGWLVSSLLLTGAVLLGWGDGAPRGWAGFLAVAVAVYALLALPRAFIAAGHLVAPDRLQILFSESIRPQVAEAVQRDLLTITMRQLLDKAIATAGAAPREWDSKNTSVAHVAMSSGLVADVDLRILSNRLKPLRSVEARLPLFSRVRRGDGVTWSETAKTPAQADFLMVARAGRTGERWDEFRLVRNLELDGHDAIKGQDAAALTSCMQLHEDTVRVLLEFEEAVTAVGLPSLLSNTDLAHRVRYNLLFLHQASVDVGYPDGSGTIASATLGLIGTTIDLDHVDLARQLISTLGAMAVYEVKRA